MVKKAMINGFKEALNLEFLDSTLTKEELELAKQLYNQKYSNDEWNLIR